MTPIPYIVMIAATVIAGLAPDHRVYKLADHKSDAAFVLLDLKTNRIFRHNTERCAARFSPFSTFKIPHSIIALETGVAESPRHLQKWEPAKYPREDWMSEKLAQNWLRDHTLHSAFKLSAVWYYRELAPKIGENDMNRYLTRFDYGNRDTSSGIDRFWLDGSLNISADEQVNFLKRFYQGRLDISARTRDFMKNMMVLQEKDPYRISGKTGSNLKGFGWLVGYVETADNTWIFAFNADLPEGQTGPGQRLHIIKNILRELKVIE